MLTQKHFQMILRIMQLPHAFGNGTNLLYRRVKDSDMPIHDFLHICAITKTLAPCQRPF
jgi:hypothetical protein